MRISHLAIRNFRSIESIDLDIGSVCALVGPNNAGKTNVLLALHRVLGYDWAQASRFDAGKDRFGHDPSRDIEIVATLEPPFPYRKTKALDATNIHALSFKLTTYKDKRRAGEPRLEQACLDGSGKVASVLASAGGEGKKRTYEQLHSVPGDLQDALPVIYIRADRRLGDQLPSARYSVLRTLLDDINKDFHDPENMVEALLPDGTSVTMSRSDRWGQLMTAAMKLLRTEDFLALEGEINRSALRQLGFNPDSDDLSLGFGPLLTLDFYRALELQLTENEITVDATTLGQGFQNAVFMAIMQAFEQRKKQGAIFLIEEPEISLHPQSQRALYSTLKAIGSKNQIIYTTHSPHFVGVPDFQHVRLIRRPDGRTTAQASDLGQSDDLVERLRKEVDPERSELFFARRVLVVEGDTEKLAFPEYAARIPLDLDRAGATIVEAGGKRNLLPLAEIAVSFGIETGIVYDRDSGSFKGQPDREAELNEQLAAFEDVGKGSRVWCLEPDYEAVLQDELGGAAYQALCQQHPGVTKPVRARLIAADSGAAAPAPFVAALRWLAGEPPT